MALRKLVCIASFLLALGVSVHGKISGAPETPDVCSTLKPQHGGIDAQTSPTPYSLQESTLQIKAGEQMTISILSSPSGPTLKGFMFQGRKSDSNDGKPAGTFIPGADQKGMKCSSVPNSALTHSNNKEVKTVQALWVAPNEPGKYVILATVVQDGATFWVAQKSRVITVT